MISEQIIKLLMDIKREVSEINARLKAHALKQDNHITSLTCPVCLSNLSTYKKGTKICCKCGQRFMRKE